MYSSSGNQRQLRVDPLLTVERSQLKWFRNLTRMPQRRLPLEVFRACATGRWPWGRLGTHWRDYISQLAWEHFGVPQEKLESVADERRPEPPTNPAACATPPQIKGRGCMDNLQLSCAYSLHCRSQMTVLPKLNKMPTKLVYRARSVELSSKCQKGYLG